MSAIESIDRGLEFTAYDEVPEHLRPGEYGEKVTRPIPLGLLIRLSQTREGINPALGDLKSSISRRGIINQPDIARVRRPELAQYIDFVNNTWRSDWQIDNLPSDDEGFYYLVVAGHSRIEAITQLEHERSYQAGLHGFATDYRDTSVVCKITDTLTPEEIIAYQLDENIHKEPAQERVAIALVETYVYGVRTGQWRNKTEFLRQAGSHFSRQRLNDALAFADLPAEVRDFALSGIAKYGVVVEVAKATSAYRDYVRFRYLRHLKHLDPKELETELDQYVTEWAGREIATLTSNKVSITIARQRYKNEINSWQTYTQLELRREAALRGEPVEGVVDVPMFGSDYTLDGPLSEWRDARRRLREDYRRLLNEMADKPFNKVVHALQVHVEAAHLKPDEKHQLLEVLNKGLHKYAKRAGKTALSLAANSESVA